ncbi:MAG: hypothetical protein N2Z67_02040 [Acetobacteraceae bacterium]|nr:hypothetical protein [Acetobacteraceae bacterium]
MKAANSAGPPSRIRIPCCASRARTAATPSASRVTWLSRATTGAGSPAGPASPNHAVTSKPGSPSSASGRTSGSSATGRVPDSPIGRIRPPCTSPTAAGTEAKVMSVCRASTALMLSGAERKGTCVSRTPVICSSTAPPRCCEVPDPPEEQASSPGRARAAARMSATVRNGLSGCTTSTLGLVAISVIGVKSATGSKGIAR